jgi:hypothetical protein
VPPDRVQHLSAQERDLIAAALAAAIHGPYFPDWEFASLIALEREEIAEILTAWPEATVVTSWETDAERVQAIAVNNVLTNLLGYPHGLWNTLAAQLTAGEAEIRSLRARWNETR